MEPEFTPAPPSPFPSRLEVRNNKIVDEDREEAILRGVAIIDPLVWRDFHFGGLRFSEEAFRVLAQEWHAGIVRVPIHPELFQHNPNYLVEFIDPLVAWAEKFELYLLLGYHAHGNPISGATEETPWANQSPWHGNPYNPSLTLAAAALEALVTRYGEKPWILYGTFNEPAFITWEAWRPLAEQLVDVVHAVNPNVLVMVSGVNFASDLSSVLADPVDRPNVVYEIHPYPWVGEGWKSIVSQLAEAFPVFIGEWGFGDEHPASADGYGRSLVNFGIEQKLGWTAWVWDHSWTPRMFDASGNNLTEFGALVKSTLQ